MRFAFYLFLLFTFASCASEAYYESYVKTSNDFTWSREDVKKFEFQVKEKTAFRLKLKINYLTGFRWDTLNLKYNIDGPSNFHHEQIKINIPMKSINGENLDQAKFDIWEKEFILHPIIILEKGSYTMNLVHDMPEDELACVTELGLQIELEKN
jgi:gliding motility-associated lipoprotein GldH